MTFEEYERLSQPMAVYPELGHNLLYPACGAAGEAGELLDKIKKHWRKTHSFDPVSLDPLQKHEIIKELGDVLWYVAAIARELGTPLNQVAHTNISKLVDRHTRGVIIGEGDNR